MYYKVIDNCTLYLWSAPSFYVVAIVAIIEDTPGRYPFSAAVPIGYRWWSLVSGQWTTKMEQFTSVNTHSTVSAVI